MTTLRFQRALALAAALPATGGCDPAEPACPQGKEATAWGCLPRCAPGKERVGRVCRDKCPPDQERVAGDCVTEFDVTPAAIRLNSVGFLPDRVKLASIPSETVEPEAERFFVRRAEDDAEQFSGESTEAIADPDTGELVWIADFSELAEPGEYYIEVPGVGVSPRFVIGPDAYGPVLNAVMLGLHGQRCGTEVSFRYAGWRFAHDACHLDDASLKFVTGASRIQPATRGWHDAGDYGKYTVNGAFALGMVLLAWEHSQSELGQRTFDIPETGGALPDYLAEAKWQLDWLLGMQLEDGSAAHKLTPVDFASTVMPDSDFSRRYLSPAGTTATATFTAALAQGARIYESYDEEYGTRLREAAQRGYAYLREHPDWERADLSKFAQGQYENPDADDRIWAAAEMWETTGDPDALADFEGRVWSEDSAELTATVRLNWDWSNTANLGLYTYALSGREGRNPDLLAVLQQELIENADRIVRNTELSRYGRGLDPGTYYWGINGVVARTSINLRVAYLLSEEPAYLDALVQQVDHLLGRNALGRSMVTGLGHFAPVAPHHRPSMADGVPPPWPGLLVGGPQPTAVSYQDEAHSYTVNEVAINWNAALVYAVAGFGP
jgi:endoglucanase